MYKRWSLPWGRLDRHPRRVNGPLSAPSLQCIQILWDAGEWCVVGGTVRGLLFTWRGGLFPYSLEGGIWERGKEMSARVREQWSYAVLTPLSIHCFIYYLDCCLVLHHHFSSPFSKQSTFLFTHCSEHTWNKQSNINQRTLNVWCRWAEGEQECRLCFFLSPNNWLKKARPDVT